MYNIDLKEFRRVNRMTQTALAAYFGITQAFVSNMEAGRDTIPEKYIRKILDDPNVDSSMVTSDSLDENQKISPEDDFQHSIFKALSAVDKIAESNRLLAESNHDLTITNKILATSNTDLVQKLAGLLEEIRDMKSTAAYPPISLPKGQTASDVDNPYIPKTK